MRKCLRDMSTSTKHWGHAIELTSSKSWSWTFKIRALLPYVLTREAALFPAVMKPQYLGSSNSGWNWFTARILTSTVATEYFLGSSSWYACAQSWKPWKSDVGLGESLPNCQFPGETNLTMTWRCTTGVMSLSFKPFISLNSPVSLLILKCPSSSSDRVTESLMWHLHTSDLNLFYQVLYLREWHSWWRNWHLYLHPLHEWDPEKIPAQYPVMWYRFGPLWIRCIWNLSLGYQMFEHVTITKVKVYFNKGKKKLTSSPSVTLTMYTGLLQILLVSSWNSNTQGTNCGYWSSPSWTMMVTLVLML